MTYMGGPYYPWWLDNLADDATLEGAAMNGAAQGAKAVRSITVTAREICEDQEFSFASDYADNGFLELYTAQVRGEPTSVVVTVTSNAAGQAQHVVNHRPRSSVLLISRLWARSSPAPPWPSTSSPANPEPLPDRERPHWPSPSHTLIHAPGHPNPAVEADHSDADIPL